MGMYYKLVASVLTLDWDHELMIAIVRIYDRRNAVGAAASHIA